MKRKLTATGPDGLFASRSTDRNYTHVVWIQTTEVIWTRKCNETISCYEGFAERNRRALNGLEPRYLAQYGEQVVKDTLEDYEAHIKNMKAKRDAGFQGEAWRCEHWCGRYDLAVKAMSKWSVAGYKTFIGEVFPQIEKGSRWIGSGTYYNGEITVDRVTSSGASTWIAFYLQGHGDEEVEISDFLRHFKPNAEPVLVVDGETNS